MDLSLYQPTARDLMSAPVHSISPDLTLAEAEQLLRRYGHSGLPVVDETERLVGLIARRDLDLALRHGLGQGRVRDYMATDLKTASPDTGLAELETMLLQASVGRLPVLQSGMLVGIVTRTDLLRGHASPQPAPSMPTLPPALDRLLSQIAAEAAQHGWDLYLVGGAVRDLLLAGSDSPQPLRLKDIDLVVDGCHRNAGQNPGPEQRAAGVELARVVQQLYPTVQLQIHGKFQTAALSWHQDAEFGTLGIDIATARTEIYPYPAANPEVEASSIWRDLYRRDFTINALAVRLTRPPTRQPTASCDQPELIAAFGGLRDLAARQIQVLHANSFIEDPTRIYRAVRFAVRLGFELAPQTAAYLRTAIESGIYAQVQANYAKVPALQTRLIQELRLSLEADYWQAVLQKLAELGALCCIHPDLQLSPDLISALHQAITLQAAIQNGLKRWLIMLEVMLVSLSQAARVSVAQKFQLSAEVIQRLQTFEQHRDVILAALPACERPSQVVKLLRAYDASTLILVAVGLPSSPIPQYLTDWSQVRAPLDGSDLKAMGYQSGRQFKQILNDLLNATLDGEIQDREAAKKFLAERYP